jgi:hypothetical protein
MNIDVEVKKKITVDGKNYESLNEVPPELRASILKNFLSNPTNSKTTIHVNGKTYSSVEDLPAALRAIVGGLASVVMKPEGEAVRPEPVLSVRMIVIALALAALLFWLVRLVL